MAKIKDPLLGYNFRVLVGETTVGGFTNISNIEVEVVKANYYGLKIPSHIIYPNNVILKKGIILNSDFTPFNWFNAFYHNFKTEKDENKMRNSFEIHLMDDSGENIKRKYSFFGAWPVRYSASDLEALGDEVAVEEIELTFQYFSVIDINDGGEV